MITVVINDVGKCRAI